MINYKEENVHLMLVIAVSVGLLFVIIVGIPIMRFFIKDVPPYCQYGDINGDGVIDSHDYQCIPANWNELERADVNNDGVFDNNDVELIIGYMHGSISQFPVASLQYDTPPYVSEIYGKTEGATGEGFIWSASVNESNGELMKGYVKIVKDGITVKQFPDVDLQPGDTITITYFPEEAGSYEVWCYVTYKYRQVQWWIGTPLEVEVYGTR